MSEELATGTDFTLANHGLKPAPTEPESAEPETYGAGIEGALEAANDLTLERGSSETEPVERFLEWKTGSKAGERVDLKAERMSLTTEQAAKTLTEVHRTEDAIEAHSNLSELQREVDLARAQLGGPEHVDGLAKLQAKALLEAEINAEAEAALMAAQPEGGEQPSTGIDADFAALLERKPQLRAQLEAPFQQAEAARQAFTGATAQVTGLLVAELAADLPEIMNLPPEQRLVGLQILQSQQPERFALLEAKAGRIQSAYNAHMQNTAAAAQQQQQQFQSWAKAEDKALEAKVPEIANDPDMKVSRAALKSLKDVGYTEQELAAAWNGQPFSMRDHRAQLLIWKAAQYDMARAGIKPEPKSLPPVQRPGIAPSPGERTAVDVSNLKSEFKKASNNEQLRLAVKLQQAQRAARR